MTSPAPRLTQFAALAGCAAKAGAGSLDAVLRLVSQGQDVLGRTRDPRLMVGLDEPDDAAIYRVGPDQALVVTIDFFAPIIDDPYCYGAISAANALSDVYAMGGDVAFALNICGFPYGLEEEVIAGILQGGVDKVIEAGGVVAGGHTIIDAEPKYGLCVIGFVHPDRVLTKAGARAGDAIYVTKPIGTGLVTTAQKFDEADPSHAEAAIRSMMALNREAACIVRDAGVSALTDVTGFGILGHAREIAAASGVRMVIEASRVPLLPGALDYAYRGVISGGGLRNRDYLGDKVIVDDAVDDDLQHVLYDPQTSGGLLFTIAAERAAAVEQRFAEEALPLWRVGVVDSAAAVAEPAVAVR